MKKSSPANKVVGIILAILFGVSMSGAVGYILNAGEFLSALSVFSSMLLAFVFGFGGIVPAAVMAVTMLVSGYFAGGVIISGYLFLIGILPGFMMIYGSVKHLKFFSQIRNALIAELISFVLVLLAVRILTGQDFAAFFRTVWEDMLSMLPQESKDAFAQFLNEMINQQNAAENAVATEDMLNFISEGMEQTLSVMMPFALVLYSVINATIGVLWMNWLRVRHGEENVEYVPVSGWRLSKQVTLGLLVIYIAVTIISGYTGEAGVSAQIIVIAAVFAAATIQASASFLSRFKIMGISKAKSILFLALMLFLSGPFFMIYGIMSALFGINGLFVKKRKLEKMDGMPFKPMNQDKDDQQDNDQNDKEDE